MKYRETRSRIEKYFNYEKGISEITHALVGKRNLEKTIELAQKNLENYRYYNKENSTDEWAKKVKLGVEIMEEIKNKPNRIISGGSFVGDEKKVFDENGNIHIRKVDLTDKSSVLMWESVSFIGVTGHTTYGVQFPRKVKKAIKEMTKDMDEIKKKEKVEVSQNE